MEPPWGTGTEMPCATGEGEESCHQGVAGDVYQRLVRLVLLSRGQCYEALMAACWNLPLWRYSRLCTLEAE